MVLTGMLTEDGRWALWVARERGNHVGCETGERQQQLGGATKEGGNITSYQCHCAQEPAQCDDPVVDVVAHLDPDFNSEHDLVRVPRRQFDYRST